MIASLLARMQSWLPAVWRPARASISDALWAETLARLPFLDYLTEEEQRQLKSLCETLLQKIPLAGVGELEVDDATAALVAAQACLLVLKLDLFLYDDMPAILILPDAFNIRQRQMDEAGVMHEWDEEAAGEAIDQGGAVLLSMPDLMQPHDPAEPWSLVIHEFAHKIDMGRGAANGFPPFLDGLHSHAALAGWTEAFGDAYDDFCKRVDKTEAQLPPDFDPDDEAQAVWYDELMAELPLDPYAASDPAEFFAVASESFFVAPSPLAEAYPQVYRLLAAYYRQDPLAARDGGLNPHRDLNHDLHRGSHR